MMKQIHWIISLHAKWAHGLFFLIIYVDMDDVGYYKHIEHFWFDFFHGFLKQKYLRNIFITADEFSQRRQGGLRIFGHEQVH